MRDNWEARACEFIAQREEFRGIVYDAHVVR